MFGSTASQSLSVIDPCNRTGKIEVPMSFVTETKGVTDWLRYGQNPPPDAKDLSLCLLFQRGRCNAGSKCNQVHAAAEYVEILRQRASSVKSCCSKHGDVHSTSLDASMVVTVASETQSLSYSLADFACTEALDIALRRARDGVARVSGNRICRLHQKGSCKFGKDCKNVHLCSSATPLVDAKPVKAAVVTPSPKPRVAAPSAAAAPVAAVTTAPAATVSAVPALGMAFRAIDITNRACDVSVSSISSERSASKPSSEDSGAFIASARPACLSLLSGMDEFEFNSIRTHNAGDYLDPLDILDNGSSFSDLSARDFDAFVDALCECGPDTTLASPHWIAA